MVSLMPDVLGLELEQARAMLEAAGFDVEVQETRTSRRVLLEGPLRVVRQRLQGARVRLIVTRERYAPAPKDVG